MSRIRQLYFSLVSFAALTTLLSGLVLLGQVLLEQTVSTALGDDGRGLLTNVQAMRERTAFGIALSAIGGVIWLLHWRAVVGSVKRPDAGDERRSGLRRLYLYGVLLMSAVAVYISSRDLVEALFRLALLRPGTLAGARDLARPLPTLLAGLATLAYHWRIAATDRAEVGEVGAGATLRRWFAYGLLVAGVVPLMVNAAALVRATWEQALDRPQLISSGISPLAGTVVSHGSTVLVALAVWLLAHAWVEGAARQASWYGENERRSVLRRVFLYSMVLVTVAAWLAGSGRVLYLLLLQALGLAPTDVGGQPIQAALGEPISWIIVYGGFWLVFRRAVRLEANAQAEVGAQAGARRLYYYLVAGLALIVLSTSVGAMLRLAADWVVGPAAANPDALRRELALQLSLIAVALPTWLTHWASAQARLGEAGGPAEARSTSRRWYLYLASFGTVLTLLIFGVWIVYDLIVVALGRPFDHSVQSELARNTVSCLEAGLLLWYHWWLVLRSDRLSQREAAPSRAASALIEGLDADQVAALDRFVRERLGPARLKLSWLEESAQAPSSPGA